MLFVIDVVAIVVVGFSSLLLLFWSVVALTFPLMLDSDCNGRNTIVCLLFAFCCRCCGRLLSLVLVGAIVVVVDAAAISFCLSTVAIVVVVVVVVMYCC